MPYIVDGHNLIPKLPGLSLDQIDDEMALVELLQEFCRRGRKKVDVFFDKAAPGGSRAHNFGSVTARFTYAGRTADDAIRSHIKRLGKEARNYTVVSSDRDVQSAARAARARVMSSKEFADVLLSQSETERRKNAESGQPSLNQKEIDEWLELFGTEED